MAPEIKQRIEQIRNGEVPERYKRTRAGIMPCDWCTQKEYKAKDIFYSVSNKNHNGDYEVLSATQDRGVIPRSQVDIDIKYDDANTSGYKMVDKGDFVISLRSFQGGIEYSEYTGLVSPAYTVLKPRVSIFDEYYKSYFKTNDFISRLNKGTYGIRDGKQVGFKDFGEMIIHFPPIPEQQRIAKILSAQDKVIECYEKKIEQLRLMKNYYLQNMFPKRGETVPKIRFKGFTDPWEQRKVRDVSEIVAGGTPNTSIDKYWEPKEIPWLASGEVHKKIITFTDDMISKEGMNNSSAKLIKEKSLLIALAGQGKTRGTVAINHIPLTTNQSIAAMTFINDIVPEFVFCNLENRYDEIRRMSSGDGSRGGLNKQIVGSIEIPYTSKSEQELVGKFFTHFDTLITLHQRKLEEEKKKKKALQQLLLTGIVRTN